MLKPLSQKSLEKKYKELGLPQQKVDLLHQYFLCFSNLYGAISVGDAWTIFREYEGLGYVKKKEFYAFSGIAQREEQPYAICELDEVYSEESDCSEKDRLIINKELIGYGHYKFADVWRLENARFGKPCYVPERHVFMTHVQDQFWRTRQGKEMKQFLENIRSCGTYVSNYRTMERKELIDIHGNKVKGRAMKDITVIDFHEQFMIDYEKRESRKKALAEEYSVPASEKLMYMIKHSAHLGTDNPAEDLSFFFRFFDEVYGAQFSVKEAQRFVRLQMNLNNDSNLWVNWGYAPMELHRVMDVDRPMKVTLGPGIQQAIKEGKIDGEALEKFLKENNLD